MTHSQAFERRPSALKYMLRGALPASRRFVLVPPIAARWRGHIPDARQLDDYERITGLRARPTLPLLYPHTFGFRLAMSVLTDRTFPVPIWGVLQTRNHLLEHRPIAADAVLDFETRVSDGRVLEKGAEIDLHTTVHVEGELAWESVVTYFTRGRFGDAGPASPLARSPAADGPLVADWPMRDADHWRFGAFTGDYNGIHMWDWYARRFGFPRALYHPQRVLAECIARLGDGGARPRRLDAWLKGPVHHGATVRLHAASDAGATTFACYAEDERPSIVGRLSATAEPPGRLPERQA